MKRQRESINFECGSEFIIVPVEKAVGILEGRGEAERVYIPKEELFPYGYMEYLKKVLNINRHLPEFSFVYIEEFPIRETGVVKIMMRQLGKMMINGMYCFEDVKLVTYGSRILGFEMGFGKGRLTEKEPSGIDNSSRKRYDLKDGDTKETWK